MRTVALREAGLPNGTVAALMGVSIATARSWQRRQRRTGSVAPTPRGPRGCAIDAYRGSIERVVRESPGLTLEQLRAQLAEQHGFAVSVPTVHRALRRYGLTLKKSHSMPPSRPGPMSRRRASTSATR